jgi:hypothetical protein
MSLELPLDGPPPSTACKAGAQGKLAGAGGDGVEGGDAQAAVSAAALRLAQGDRGRRVGRHPAG